MLCRSAILLVLLFVFVLHVGIAVAGPGLEDMSPTHRAALDSLRVSASSPPRLLRTKDIGGDDEKWSALFAGPDAISGASHVIEYDGTIVKLAGFYESGGRETLGIAQWRDGGWFAMDGGFESLTAQTMFVFRDELFVAGRIGIGQYHDQTYYELVRWTGTEWVGTTLPSRADPVRFVQVGDALIGATSLAFNGGRILFRWDGENFSGFGQSIPREFPGTVHAMAYDGESRLALGGHIGFYGNRHVRNVVLLRLDGGEYAGFELLGDGLPGRVYDLAFYQGDLIAAGWFFEDDPLKDQNVACFRNGVWEPMGDGLQKAEGNASVYDLEIFEGKLIASGSFTHSGGRSVRGLAVWDGGEWIEFAGGLRSGGLRMSVEGHALYLSTGGVPNDRDIPASAHPISVYRHGEWVELGRGLEGPSRTLLVADDRLYVAGSFTQAGYVKTGRIAAWDGHRWTALASDVDGRINALEKHSGDIVVAGNFAYRGESEFDPARGRVARLAGSNVEFLGDGLNGEVLALASLDGKLYAGGAFQASGLVPTSRIASWNEHGWAPLRGGVDGPVHALQVQEGELIVGGDFSYADGRPARHIARWNGSEWFALGEGLPDRVETLATHGGKLYAGGFFASEGLYGVAVWDGASWTAVGKGIRGVVFGLRSDGIELLAVGWFDSPEGTANCTVASWNGRQWQYSSAGTDGWVEDAVRFDGDLFLAGRFRRVANQWSSNLARRLESPNDPSEEPNEVSTRSIVGHPSPNPANPASTIRFEVSTGAQVQVEVHDVRGRRIRSWPATRLEPGHHAKRWDGRDDLGREVSSGVYWMRIRIGEEAHSRKVVIVR